MAPLSQEDLEWFKSTFHPVPRPQLPDCTVEYSLYLISSDPAPAVVDAVTETRAKLQEVQKSASALTSSLLGGYIWQREPFRLQITKENGITFLRGQTNYGDSIEDEWVIVYILRELTRQYKDLWVKVVDSDGEFLLIEAASKLPSWLEPDVADNRVWINQGQLVIIKPKREESRVQEKISIEEARKIIVEDPKRLMRSPEIEEEAFYRLRNYPEQIQKNHHSALITVPRKVAHLLHQKPAYISPVVEAFYLRDPIAMRPLRSKTLERLFFPPDDLVTVSVRFTRVGYAQLKSQDFPTPRFWIPKLPPRTDFKAYARAETGMKVTSGFEMLLSDPQNQDKAVVREVKLILEDIDAGEDSLPTDEDLRSWSQHEDDEKWLDITYDDLDAELKGRQRDASSKPGAFGDTAAQENLRRIVEQFEKFLNDESAGLDGADFFGSDTEFDDDDDESSSEGEDAFDEEHSKVTKNMGMPSGSRQHEQLQKNRIEELDSEDDSEEIEELSRMMEAELRPTGVLNLNSHKDASRSSKSVKGKEPVRNDDEIDIDEEAEEDPNINLAKNLLESLQSQAGMPGPGQNILSMMGMRPPKDNRP